MIRFDNRDAGLSTRFNGMRTPGWAALVWAYMRGRRARVPYTLGDMASDAVGLLDVLGLSSAHVVGGSLGGMVDQTMAISHPERVRSLVSLMAMAGGWFPPPSS